MTDIPETHYARTPDGVHIAYQVIGDGPVDLLWLDGLRGNLEVMWEQPLVAGFFTKLASRSRVIRFDLRGTGLSDRGEQPPNLETQIEDARTVLDLVGSYRTAIVGHGWGSSAASLFASTFPERTRSLILISASARNRWAPDYPWGFTEEVLDRSLALLESGWGTTAYAAMEVSFAAESMVEDRDYIRWVAKVQRHWVGPKAAVALEHQYWDSDVRDVLRSLRVPTLVVAREWEDMEEDEYIAGLITDSRLVRVSGRDWMIWVGDQDPAVAAIHGFLEVEGTRSSTADEGRRALATVLFTDIVGSTARSAKIGDRAWQDVRAQHDSIVRSALATHRGSEVKTMGDGFLATFDGPARAVRCARAIVDEVRALGIELRAGLHTGEITHEGDDISGIAVAIGARIGAKAGASEVLASSTVKDLVAGSGLTFEDAGEHELKGVPDRWRLYRVVDV